MKNLRIWTLFFLILSLMPSPVAAAPVLAHHTTLPSDNNSLWTAWNPTHYALTEDATSLWIGAAGGVIRWDKQGGTYRRYTTIDGLPHSHVYAVAVDNAGNRWFGGDGGLSRLDANEVWSHITPANSTLTHRLIDGIAVGADGTLWVSHGATGGVSRRRGDGGWQWFPNRATAVLADYALILQTQNVNRLWTVQGALLWIDYAVYDGATWTDRTPPGSVAAVVDLVVDGDGVVWVLDKNPTIRKWDGVAWLPFTYRYERQSARLAVDDQGTVWVAWGFFPALFDGHYAGYGKLLDPATYQELTPALAPAALLPTTNGAWATGFGWLALPNQTVYSFTDTPVYPNLGHVFTDRTGQLWLFSNYGSPAGSSFHEGWLQTIDDNGTASLADDQWTVRHRIMYFDLARQGYGDDLWLAWSYVARSPLTHVIERWHDGAWIRYTLPATHTNVPIIDIFAQNERQAWFVYRTRDGVDPPRLGVLGLDDGGTPTEANDDQWRDYPVASAGYGGSVVVDTLGRLWYGDSAVLYRYDGKQWQPFRVDWYNHVTQLLPAPNGALLVIERSDMVSVIEVDDTYRSYPFATFIHEQLPLLRAVGSSSLYWTLAPDGAVWYTSPTYANPRHLYRYDGVSDQQFTLQAPLHYLTTPIVDAHNHVWGVGNSLLWRLSAPPLFRLQVAPNPLLVARGRSAQGQVLISSQEGYTAPVTLQLGALPASLTATVEPSIALPGETVTLTVMNESAAALGDYSIPLIGRSDTLTQTASITVTVVEKVYGDYLPVVGR